MAAVAVENLPSVTTESKSARKKKAKADAGTNGTTDAAVAIPIGAPKDSSTLVDTENTTEHPYIRDLQKNIRNVNKKLGGLQKIDAIIAENKGVPLDDLVKQRKINADQKASIEKKPQLLANLAQFEEQVEQYRKFDNDHQLKLKQQKEELSLEFETKLADVRSEIQAEVADKEAGELQKKLLIFSQFLRAAAHKRTMEEEADTDLSMAFEGVLLLAYGGDQRAVDTAVSLINGSSESAPDVDGNRLPINYSQIRQASIDYAPFQAEEAWIEQTAEATLQNTAGGVDPTIANAGLTELQMDENVDAMATLAVTADETSGNVAGESWDTAAPGAAGEGAKGGIDDSYEIIPRPADEVDAPVTSVQQSQSTRWDEEPPTYETATGNKASEQWDVKAPGELVDDGSWASASVQTGNNITTAAGDGAVPLAEDGFHEVAGRQRGRGGVGGGRGRGRGGDGEFRGRGGRRGHFRGGRGGGSDGEFRGRGGFRGGRGAQGDPGSGGRGRGRGGPRGGAPSMVPDS